MNAEHLATIRGLLEAAIAGRESMIRTRARHGLLSEYPKDNEWLSRYKDALAQLDTLETWQPVEDDWSFSSDETLSLRVKDDGRTVVATDYAVYGTAIPNISRHLLPRNIRLCKRTPPQEPTSTKGDE